MTPSLLADVARAIAASEDQPFVCVSHAIAGGGCINRGYVLIGSDGRKFFAKVNEATTDEMFAAEADGLRELARVGAIRVPRPICVGRSGDEAFLVLEWLPLEGPGNSEDLGRCLARLHQRTQTDFGWWRDNTIGSTPQHNGTVADWPTFYLRRRLQPQLDLARRNGAPRALLQGGERLAAELHVFFAGHRPLPSLLHGDLWGGNYGYAEGEPVLFDPAVYFGDREAEMAMTELFGGFPDRFYSAYREAWPLGPGYAVRRQLYNLYHVLNHFNLFGGGYGSQAQAMMASLLSELG